MHNGPLRRGGAPALLRRLLGEAHDTAAPNVHVQGVALHVDARPHELARARHALDGAATARKVHGRLTLAHRALQNVNGICHGATTIVPCSRPPNATWARHR